MKELYPAAGVKLRPQWLTPLGLLTLVGLIAAETIAWRTSPPAEGGMGNLQKILYVHVPAAWAAMLAFFVVFLFSIAYLATKKLRFDLLAAASAEVGVLMTGIAVALGSIWGRPTWGIWWTWDPRITSSAIMLMMYIGYLALRGFTDEEDRRARWSAAVGIIAFLNVPIVFWSVQWWRSLHQVPVTRDSMSGTYWTGLWMNAFAFLLVMIFFIASRYHVAELERAVELKREADAMAGGGRNV
jgi:heme exporter protein C